MTLEVAPSGAFSCLSSFDSSASTNLAGDRAKSCPRRSSAPGEVIRVRRRSMATTVAGST